MNRSELTVMPGGKDAKPRPSDLAEAEANARALADRWIETCLRSLTETARLCEETAPFAFRRPGVEAELKRLAPALDAAVARITASLSR